MIDRSAVHANNAILQWLWRHGWEEPIGPLGPLLGKLGPEPDPWRQGPHPDPWRMAVPQLIQAAQARDLAQRLPGPLQEEAVRSASAAIEAILDDWCGTPPRRWPWPWPGPPPWAWEIAAELQLAAHALQPGSLQDGLLDVAAQVAQKAAGSR